MTNTIKELLTPEEIEALLCPVVHESVKSKLSETTERFIEKQSLKKQQKKPARLSVKQAIKICSQNDATFSEAAHMDFPFYVKFNIGQMKMTMDQFIKLSQGRSVTLDINEGESIELFVNDQLFACGEIIQHKDKLSLRLVKV